MKIALFGGSFDPPHLAHSRMVQTLLDRRLFDQVWYVPVGEHQSAFTKQMSLVQDRLQMLALIKTAHTRVELYEVKSGQPSHTHTTLNYLSRRYPQHQFSFLMGADQLAKLAMWRCDQDDQCFPGMADQYVFYVYPRVGYQTKLPYTNLKLIKDVAPMATSSTQIRNMVKKGLSITKLVDSQVEQYIITHGLYGLSSKTDH